MLYDNFIPALFVLRFVPRAERARIIHIARIASFASRPRDVPAGLVYSLNDV
jgi:hypothetical protein